MAPARDTQPPSSPLDFTEEQVKLFQEGKGKDVFQEVADRAQPDQPKKSAGTRKKAPRPPK